MSIQNKFCWSVSWWYCLTPLWLSLISALYECVRVADLNKLTPVHTKSFMLYVHQTWLSLIGCMSLEFGLERNQVQACFFIPLCVFALTTVCCAFLSNVERQCGCRSIFMLIFFFQREWRLRPNPFIITVSGAYWLTHVRKLFLIALQHVPLLFCFFYRFLLRSLC